MGFGTSSAGQSSFFCVFLLMFITVILSSIVMQQFHYILLHEFISIIIFYQINPVLCYFCDVLLSLLCFSLSVLLEKLSIQQAPVL